MLWKAKGAEGDEQAEAAQQMLCTAGMEPGLSAGRSCLFSAPCWLSTAWGTKIPRMREITAQLVLQTGKDGAEGVRAFALELGCWEGDVGLTQRAWVLVADMKSYLRKILSLILSLLAKLRG